MKVASSAKSVRQLASSLCANWAGLPRRTPRGPDFSEIIHARLLPTGSALHVPRVRDVILIHEVGLDWPQRGKSTREAPQSSTRIVPVSMHWSLETP